MLQCSDFYLIYNQKQLLPSSDYTHTGFEACSQVLALTYDSIYHKTFSIASAVPFMYLSLVKTFGALCGVAARNVEN